MPKPTFVITFISLTLLLNGCSTLVKKEGIFIPILDIPFNSNDNLYAPDIDAHHGWYGNKLW